MAGAGLPVVNRSTKKKTGRDPRPVRLFIVGVDGAKAVIYHRLANVEPGPGYRHFNNDLDQEYFEGLTAEKIVTKHRRGFEYREWIKTRPRNEPLDIAVLNYAALKILNPTWQAIATQARPAPTQPRQPKQESQFTRQDW
jgi:phage terminase large subunit GpA-like protein